MASDGANFQWKRKRRRSDAYDDVCRQRASRWSAKGGAIGGVAASKIQLDWLLFQPAEQRGANRMKFHANEPPCVSFVLTEIQFWEKCLQVKFAYAMSRRHVSLTRPFIWWTSHFVLNDESDEWSGRFSFPEFRLIASLPSCGGWTWLALRLIHRLI